MNENDIKQPVVHDFVDEAGTPTLFAKRRKVIVGQEGCSNFFLLGKVTINDPTDASLELEKLRLELLADPYFRGVPSMLPAANKTALAFHAKDDVAEVRREVFKLLIRLNLRFQAVVRDKHSLVQEVRRQNAEDPGYRYSENTLYDSMVTKLFESHFFAADDLFVTFAKRGIKPRTAALSQALEHSRRTSQAVFGTTSESRIGITPSTPHQCVPLQIVDYYLWALQRFYEQREDRFLNLIWPQTSIVIDIDDKHSKRFGGHYSKSNPLTLAVRFGEGK